MMRHQQAPSSAMSWKCTSAGCLGLEGGLPPAHTPLASPRSALAIIMHAALHVMVQFHKSRTSWQYKWVGAPRYSVQQSEVPCTA